MVKKHFKPQPKIRKKAPEKITAKDAAELISGISASYKMLEKLASGDPFARISLKTKNPRLKKLESLLNQTAKSFQEMIDQSHELTIGISEHYDVLSRIAAGNRAVRAREDSENELIAKLGLLINKETSALTQQITEAENSSLELALGLSENFEVLRRLTLGDLDVKAPEESKNELLAKLGVVINRTVLSLKNTLDALESSRSYLENIIRSMKDSLIVSDSDGRVVLINPATTELLGYGEEIKGHLFSAICIEDAQESSTFCKDWRERLKEEGFVKNKEAVYKTKFGEEIPVSFSGSLLKDRKAEVVGFVCVAKDMREIKRHIERERMLAMEASKSAEAAKKRAEELYNAYQELKKTQAQLLQAEKLSSIGRLGAGVAHELNSPLTGLLSLLRSYRKESKEDSREHEDFTDMVLAGEHMAKIISDLNSFARISKEELANLSFKDVIESTLSFSEHPLIQKNIKIIKEYAPDLAKVRGDKGKLQQVVLNLLTNAYDAMPNGGSLTIKTRNSENGGQVIVEFIDTGIGIRQEDLLRVFEPFFTTKEPGKGTGLGLYISHGIIETHGGKISVESRVGEGAKFTILLPAVEKRGA